MAFEDARTVVASAARTTSSNSGGIRGRFGESLALLVDVSAVTGTSPTLDLSVEWSHDGTTFAAAESADSFAQITGTKTTVKRFDAKGPFYRVVWATAGTSPSFTFSVSEYLT